MNQDTFTGGLQQQYDATKTAVSQYRAALNCRVRRNVAEPSFKHIRVQTKQGKHQALFSLDTHLILVVAARLYQIRLSDRFVHEVGDVLLSQTTEYIYHENVPAPTNFFIGPDHRYASTFSTTPLVAVLQDGVVQPWLLSSELGIRIAKTFDEWTYDTPEYVPIGTYMAFTGAVLYIASPDKSKEYRSVSGRPLDFVLSFDSITGNRIADANSTAVAVSAAPLTALLAAQDGGFIAATKYKTHAATPVAELLVFDEPYLRPRELFPVGAVSHTAFVQINGETSFVSPSGIQMFNQTAQLMTESGVNPVGAPIVQLLKRPLTQAACVSVDDYVFYAVQTIFGPGILVYDQQVQKFIGMDTVTAPVKEFAVVHDEGTTHLFYITFADELYEIPLYAGEKAMASILFGEWVPINKDGQQDPSKQHRITSVKLGLTNIQMAGFVTVRSFIDRKEQRPQVIPIDAEGTPPIQGDFPFAAELPSTVYPVTFSDTTRGYALGLQIDVAVDARLAALSVATEVTSAEAPRYVQAEEPEVYLVVGNVTADSRYTDDFDAISGAQYIAEADTTASTFVLNAGNRVVLREGGHVSQPFIASAGRLYLDVACTVYDYRTLKAWGERERLTGAFVLGSPEVTNKYAALFNVFKWLALPVYAMADDYIQLNTPRAQDFFGHAGVPRYFMHIGRDIDFYCLSFPLTDLAPTELTEDGEYCRWVTSLIQSRWNIEPNRLSIIMSPVSPIDNDIFKAWPFARMGVHAVISSGPTDKPYERSEALGPVFLRIGQRGARVRIQSTPRSAVIYYEAADGAHDTTTIVV